MTEDDGVSLGVLIEGLRSPDPKGALAAIARRGPAAREAAGAVCAFIRSTGDRRLKAVALDCLGSILRDAPAGDPGAAELVRIAEGELARWTFVPLRRSGRRMFLKVCRTLGRAGGAACPGPKTLWRLRGWHASDVREAIDAASRSAMRGSDPLAQRVGIYYFTRNRGGFLCTRWELDVLDALRPASPVVAAERERAAALLAALARPLSGPERWRRWCAWLRSYRGGDLEPWLPAPRKKKSRR